MISSSWKILQGVFYLVNLIYFYFFINDIGKNINDRCKEHYHCSKYLQHVRLNTYFPFTFVSDSNGIVNYTVDMADGQWREFRGSLNLLWIAMISTVLLKHLFSFIIKLLLIKNNDTSVYIITIYRLLVGIIILYVQHGWHGLIIITISLIGFQLAKVCRGYRYAPYYFWGFALITLLFKESYRLLRYPLFNYNLLRVLFDKRYGGLYGWQLPANFLVLRILSYSLDSHWAVTKDDDKIKKQNDNKLISNDNNPPSKIIEIVRDISTNHRSLDEYNNIINYLAYILYAPLYMAGPILTFNSFQFYSNNPQKSENTIVYAFRWLYCFVLLEFLTFKFPFFAINSSNLLSRLSISEISVVFYMTLKIMWVKFLIIWRFFRLWALADGMLPPENMKKCMSNNCSLEQFWKGWHSSYNKWIVRYIYKPMGGRDSRFISVWFIFIFVAIWHDIEWKLLLWGLLNSVFYVIEAFSKRIAPTIKKQFNLSLFFYNNICSLCSATYILVLITVNLIGYSVGTGGITIIVDKVKSIEGITTIIISYYFLFIGVNIMTFLQEIGMSIPA